MTWLFPFYLLGAAAILGPILMHLRRRPPQERVEFSSLMFLEAHTPVPVSRRRLEHWLLLLLRCLVLILLALMFARPLWQGQETTATGKNEAVVLLLDRSASMRRGDLWQQTLSLAEKRLSTFTLADRVSVAVFDQEVLPLWSLGEDKEFAGSRMTSVRQKWAQTKPGWGATDLGQALNEATAWLGGETDLAGFKKRVLVISDCQEGSRLDALRSRVWPGNVLVEIQRVEVSKAADNFSISLAASADEASSDSPDRGDKSPPKDAQTRVRLASARDSQLTDFTLGWEKGGTDTVEGYLQPGATRVLTAPPVQDMAAAQVLNIRGDAWDFDNAVYVAPPQPRSVRLVFVGEEATRNEASSPLYYLSRALQKTSMLLPELQTLPATATSLPTGMDVVFVSGSDLKGSLLSSLHHFMNEGGMVVKVMDESTTPEELAGLLGTGSEGIMLKKGDASKDYLMLAEVDTAHPLLHPFADERLRDFTKLRFWKHRQLTLKGPPSERIQTLARFDNGSPALLSASLGKGTLILLASGWHPADSQLALSTKFVPLLYGWLEAAGFQNQRMASLTVGDSLPVAAGVAVITPDGKTRKLEAGKPMRAEMPGLYTLQTVPPQILAANLSPEESRVLPMDLDRLRQLGLRLEDAGQEKTAAAEATDSERLAVHEQEGRQRVWFWLLAAMLVVLAAETWLAGRIREGRAQPAYS